MSTASDSILAKIRKCLAMANDSRGNANEAAAALRQAQALMRKHGVTEGAVDASQAGAEYVRSLVSVKNPAQWEVALVNVITKAFGCVPMWKAGGPEPTNKGYYKFIGPLGHLEVALYTMTVMSRKLLKARSAYVAELPDYERKANKSMMADSFCMGWVHTISQTVEAFADPDGVSKRAVTAYIALNFPTYGKVDPVKMNSRALAGQALVDGMKAAESVSLARPMNGGEETLKLQ